MRTEVGMTPARWWAIYVAVVWLGTLLIMGIFKS